MSRRRSHGRAEMGEAISFEDVLTVLTVLLLLRLIFMVPLVNLDKAKTIAAHGDIYWTHQAIWILSHPGAPGDSTRVKPYRTPFNLDDRAAVLSNSGIGKIVF